MEKMKGEEEVEFNNECWKGMLKLMIEIFIYEMNYLSC